MFMSRQLFLFTLSGLSSLGYSTLNASTAPLSIPPSLYWDGDNGRWSTFHIQVGTPAQTVRLLPGTSASAGSTIWVVIPEGCVDVNPDLENCLNERGYLFQSNQSLTWSTQGIKTGVDGAIFSLNTFEEGNLGLLGNGSYGYDTISLGLPGSGLPTLEKQVIAGIWTDDFYLGSLGLSPVPFNFTNLDDPQPSMLGTLYNKSLIPSPSWSYTAGAYYQTPPVFGSLTLGGFDTTRFKPNNLTFAFGADFSRDLLVNLKSITYDTAGSSPLLASSIDVFIDSLVAEIWLPVDVCEEFAKQFNLTWNAQGQLYLVEEQAHAALVKQNPAFTFTIGQESSQETINIVLPYAAFDLNLTAPIVGNTSRYFPLKQAQNSTQYTFGRTFLQEAYVIADYGRRNFSVSQALFSSTSVAQNIVAIEVPDISNVHTVPNHGKKNKGSEMGKGAIAGVVIAAITVLTAAVFAAILWFKSQKKPREAPAESITPPENPAVDVVLVPPPPELDGYKTSVHEIDGHFSMNQELPAHEGHWGRHELISEVSLHELGGREVAPAATR
ncbi:hypothetical protein LARI1_G008295 [Lachnellula arida]|uniref:Peptidase A1 domain-containing protein n=1 Tax=Lachnellula arida TaxID=1316785 RepID=A0A8T9B645_9HELO|nr:hypothetical protein LARI1_G008295 [Lachnellula arida]